MRYIRVFEAEAVKHYGNMETFLSVCRISRSTWYRKKAHPETLTLAEMTRMAIAVHRTLADVLKEGDAL